MKRTSSALPLLAALALGGSARAQQLDLPRPSPFAKVSQVVGLTEIAVDYSSPGVKGRKIFGGLLPYGELWRTGANAATKITFSKDASVGGKAIAAGSYSLFTIPNKESWTVILNKNATASTREYKKEQDALRIEVRPQSVPARERLTFLFADFTDDKANLDIEWDTTRVAIPIAVNTDKQAADNIKNMADGAWRPFNAAARYQLETRKDYEAGLKLVNQSLALKEDWFNDFTKAQLLAAKGDYKAAYALAERANALGQKAEFFFLADEVKKALAEWKNK
jgi:hypothetical protein